MFSVNVQVNLPEKIATITQSFPVVFTTFLALIPSSLLAQAPRMQLWVPAYYYPFGDGLEKWNRLISSSRQVPIVAIVNPASGPGKKPDINYVALVQKAKGAKLTLVGYISTQYTRRPLVNVKAEIDTWLQFYPGIQGIHVDEQSSEADKVPYYVELCEYIRSKIPRALVLSNPGTTCAENYLSQHACDALCLFERDSGFGDFRLPAWASRYSPQRFAAQAYDVNTADKMRAYVREAARRRVGYIFITDARGANPYDRLPSYWEEEIRAVRQVNQVKGR